MSIAHDRMDRPIDRMDIKGFVSACIHYGGGLAEEEDGVLEALLPEPLRPCFRGQEMARIALDPETVRRYPDATVVLPGGPELDALIQFASLQGRVTHAFPRVGSVRPRNLSGEILHALQFTARRVRLPEEVATVEPSTVAQFDFLLSLVSDEREERLQSVVIDLWNGSASQTLTRVCRNLDVDAKGSPGERRRGVSLEKAYRRACEAIASWTAASLKRQQEQISRRLSAEHRRLSIYYDGLQQDLEQRVRKAEGTAGQVEKCNDLRSKQSATRAEGTVKLRELQEKYRLRPSARLMAIRLLSYPRLYSRVGLDRKQATRELEVCWDPVVGRLQMPRCEGCGAEASHLELTLDSRLLCRACSSSPQSQNA